MTDPGERLAKRVAALVPCSRREAEQYIAGGWVRVDGQVVEEPQFRVLGQPVTLTGTEFELLHLLAAEPGKVYSRDDILNHLRGHEAELYTRAVDIVVSRLRRKLEPLDCIKTLRNAGYALALRRTTP